MKSDLIENIEFDGTIGGARVYSQAFLLMKPL
jgi:hypothetical protein